MASKIDWTDETWNPVIGCTKCSPGCLNCYAERMAYRLACMRQEKYQKVVKGLPTSKPFWKKGFKACWTGDIYCDEKALDIPLHWHKPRRIFVCSMSDLFHPKVPFEFIDKVLYVMYRNLQHTFQILTKRPEIMLEYFVDGELLRLRLLRLFPNYTPEARLCREWPLNNIHLGVSISNQDEMWKATELSRIPATVRFISLEPMLGEIDISRYLVSSDGFVCPNDEGPIHIEDGGVGIDWVIVGCESGPKRRLCKIEWVQSIVDQCKAANVPCFVKQISIDGKVVKMPKIFPQELPERK